MEGRNKVPPGILFVLLVVGAAGTPYEGGVFRMKLVLGAEFPQVPPKGN